NADELYGGPWSLDIQSGDGQSAVLDDAVTVTSIYSYAEIQMKSCFAYIDWMVEGDTPFRAVVYRMRPGSSDTVIVTPDTLYSDSGKFYFRDTELQPERDYSYKIVSFSGSVSEPIVFPGPYSIDEMGLTLFQNYPNPFERKTTFQFFIPRSGKAKILIFDALGRKVDNIAEKFYPAGYNRVGFEADPAVFTSGVYFAVLDLSGRRETIKIVILR
ncbi:MAG TPA: T9SS type A sorting domain-containing protein, partial [Candidatus Krumholzibacteriaceae bacterium]|nr:T9SS type A sorting domain-containing protein [Candidatus Krumholzibacteriaceae bacterium]